MLKTKNSALPLDEKAVSETGTIEGYASVFGVVDSYNEVVEPGAFVDSLVKSKRTGRKIKMLYQHDPHQPIGVWDDLAEDSKGLWVKGRLLVQQSPKAAEVHGLLKEGALDGLSIGYRVIDAKPKEDKPGILSLIKLDLLENSIVTFAANERARVESVKSERMEEFARRLRDGDPMPIKEFEDILREAGVPKSMAVQIASVGYAKAIRSESEGDQANETLAFLRALQG